MSDKCYPAAQALIDRAMKVDPALAADIRAFARSREYGLVFEHNRPEAMRLYGKPVSKGDAVHILPPRGEKESAENHEEWRVIERRGDLVDLVRVSDAETRENVSVEDVVAVAEYDQPIYAGLRETGRVERGGGELGDPGDKPYHVVINGENYHALEALQFCYAGKVDCIYIDPPYNTGAKDWKYNNDYVGGDDAYRHSKWLAMMERRLKLAKELLNPNDSVLIVTIDEKEYLRLGLLLEQVFPNSKIQMISSVINPAGVSRDDMFSRTDEYIYFVMMGDSRPEKIELNENWKGNIQGGYKGKLRWNGLQRSGTSTLRSDRPNMFYPIFLDSNYERIVSVGDSIALDVDRNSVNIPDGCVAVWPIFPDGREGRWRLGQETLKQNIEKHYVRIGRPNGERTAISYLAKGEQEKVEAGQFPIRGLKPDGSLDIDVSSGKSIFVPGTQWWIKSHDATQNGTKMLSSLIGSGKFSFPKSVYAVEDAIRFFVEHKPNALILDFFAGSGTTAHAVMRLNHRDGGNRCCICVTNNETSSEEEDTLIASKFRKGDKEWESLGISELVTKPRLTAAIKGVNELGEDISGDYKVEFETYEEATEDDSAEYENSRIKLYKKIKKNLIEDSFPMKDGFNENAIFFDLTYENPNLVNLGMAYQHIAPLLWMRAGCKGEIIENESLTFELADTYAVLFDYAYIKDFEKAIDQNDAIKIVYVVTDDDGRLARVKSHFPNRDVVRLYESYLRSFRIASEGALS